MTKEYQMLREEMVKNQESINSSLLVLYTGLAAIMTLMLGLNLNEPLIICCIYILLIPISARNRALNKNNAFLAAYMAEILEPESGYNWENNLMTYRRQERRENDAKKINKSNKFIGFVTSYNSANAFIGLIGLVLYCLMSWRNYSSDNFEFVNFNFFVGLVINVVAVAVLIALMKSAVGDKEQYMENWRKLKQSNDLIHR